MDNTQPNKLTKNEKVRENYKKICEFLLSQAANSPVGTHMDFNLKKHVGHYASIEIEHPHGKVAYLRVYDKLDMASPPFQNYFYAGDDIREISKTIAKDCPSIEMMKNLVIGWHRYGIKDSILQALSVAEEAAREKLEAEEEIYDFEV